MEGTFTAAAQSALFSEQLPGAKTAGLSIGHCLVHSPLFASFCIDACAPQKPIARSRGNRGADSPTLDPYGVQLLRSRPLSFGVGLLASGVPGATYIGLLGIRSKMGIAAMGHSRARILPPAGSRTLLKTLT